jgi:hypothetical protein
MALTQVTDVGARRLHVTPTARRGATPTVSHGAVPAAWQRRSATAIALTLRPADVHGVATGKAEIITWSTGPDGRQSSTTAHPDHRKEHP